MGSRAANKAAQTQFQMAQQQAQGFRDVLGQYNPAIGTAAANAQRDVLAAANQAGVNLTDVAERGATGITGSAERANEFLQPYMGLGEQAVKGMSDFMAPGGAGTKDFTFEDMQKYDPGYQFRIDQAQRALAASGAARGGYLGGGAAKAAMQLAQNVASSEYGSAFDRFRSQQNDRFGRFSNLIDMGGRVGALAGGNLMTAAQQAAAMRTGAAQTVGGWNIGANEYGGNAMQQAAALQAQNAFGAQRSIADLMTGGAAAQAAGQVGSANAWSGMLGGIAGAANQVGGYYQQKDLLKQMQQGGYGGYGGFTPYGAARPYSPPSYGWSNMPTPGMPQGMWPSAPGYGDVYGWRPGYGNYPSR